MIVARLAPIVYSIFAYNIMSYNQNILLVTFTSLLMLRTYSAIRRLKDMYRYACFTKQVFDDGSQSRLWHVGQIFDNNVYMYMNYNCLTTMYESIYPQMYIFLV